jgi:hypothetical protein
MMNKQLLSLVAALVLSTLCCPLFAQTDSAWKTKPLIKLSGFVDVFYAWDFNRTESGKRQAFFYNHNRHNEFNLNLGYLKLSAVHDKYRANIALQAGTYTNDNYAAEPGVLKNVFEANAGVSLNRKNNLWIDAGIFASHIGFEGAVSSDNWTLTRSLLAENSPYYLSGAKLTYTPGAKWEVAALVCNGWQRIQMVKGNSLPGFGTQLKYTANEKLLLNWSTFIGTDDPDSTRRMRYFNNLYAVVKLSKKSALTIGFDIGTQQQSKGSAGYYTWLSPVLIYRYAFTDKWAAALRGEYYQDVKGVIIATATPNGFKTSGLSLNLDYMPMPNVACRVEGRWLNSADKVFERMSGTVRDNVFIAASIAVKFN